MGACLATDHTNATDNTNTIKVFKNVMPEIHRFIREIGVIRG